MSYQVRRINPVDWTIELFTSLKNDTELHRLYDEVQKRVIKFDEETGCVFVDADTVGEPRTMRWEVNGKMKSVNVYKVIFVLAFDFIYPEPLCRHLCGNRCCINENHLWPGDDQDNKLDDKFHKEHGRGVLAPKDWFIKRQRDTKSIASIFTQYLSDEWLLMHEELLQEWLAS